MAVPAGLPLGRYYPKPPKKRRRGTTAQQGALAQLKDTLAYLGIGNLSQWAWKQIVAGKSQAEILLALQQTRTFREAFPEIEARRKAGLSPMNAGQVIQYRQQVRDILNTFGVSTRVIGNRKLYQQLLIADKSPAEIERRMTRGWAEVMQSAPEVYDTFQRWFGRVGADEALATIVLDPKIGAAEVERMAAAAQIGGLGSRFGFDFGQSRARELARSGVLGGENIAQGLGELEKMNPLFDETISETSDLAAEDEGADVVFGLSGGSEVRRRGEQRQADTAGGGGAIGKEGVMGLGAAE